MQHTPKIILGIDPGTLVMGYGLICVTGTKIQLVEMSIMKMNPKKDNYERLQMIHSKITELIAQHKPDCFAIEAPFFGKNVQSMLKLGRAQGVAIAAAMSAGLEVFEYSPKKVKQSVTGNGNADKEQVWKMLQQSLSISSSSLKFLDASDALAVAVCHHYQGNLKINSSEKKLKGWAEFINKHPERLG
ncbi:MAG: crossover junction endodeoxyribonuclease RuvC [Chitinophagaceae bacterium]|nr:crossover junction endodeoxyribonuclease RuvC [Chitinophagaceae bacterium]